MGITQVDPREAERFEEGIEPEFLDGEEESPLRVIFQFITTRMLGCIKPGQQQHRQPLETLSSTPWDPFCYF